MNEIKAVFFDLDGTLIDSKKDISESVNQLRLDLDLPPLEEDFIISKVGRGTESLLKDVLPADTLNEDLFNKFIEYYKANSLKYLKFYDGALSLLTKLKLEKVLITNKNHAVTMEILKSSNTLEHFSLVYGGDSFPLRKPDPFPLIKAAKELKIPVENIIYFGDSLPDYRASYLAGINCVLATYGYGNPEELAKCDKALFIDKPLDLLHILGQLKTSSWEDLLF